MKKPRIGLVYSPWLGGSGTLATELTLELHKRGYFAKTISFSRPFRMKTRDLPFAKVGSLNYPLFPSSLYQPALTEKIVETVLADNLDIIHAHYLIPFGSSAIEAREILKRLGKKVKVIITVHGTDIIRLGETNSYLAGYLLKAADVVTAVSEDLALRAAKLIKPKSGSIRVVPNFVNETFFDVTPSVKLRKRIAPNGEKIIVHMSNLRPIKRVNDIIKAFIKINKKTPTKLVFVGDKGVFEKVGTISRRFKAFKDIVVEGKTTTPQKYWAIADLAIQASSYESFSLVLLEAAAAGVPAVSTRVGGVPDVVLDKKTGYLVKVGDIDALATYSIKILADDNLAKELGRNAIEHAKSYSNEEIFPIFESLYQSLFRLEKIKV